MTSSTFQVQHQEITDSNVISGYLVMFSGLAP